MILHAYLTSSLLFSLRGKNTAIGTSACVHAREGPAEIARRLSHSCDNIGIALQSCEWSSDVSKGVRL